MKKVLTLTLMARAMVFTNEITAQEFSGLDKSPADITSYPSSSKVSDKSIKVIYSRPQLNGRSLSELVPEGKVWRTGANEATEITLYKDMMFGDTSVKAGTYALFTIPGETEWTVILNSKINQWGAYSYDESADVARAKGSVSNSDESLEAFSIAFVDVENGAYMILGWGTTRVTVPFNLSM
jgi:hypothetical protein